MFRPSIMCAVAHRIVSSSDVPVPSLRLRPLFELRSEAWGLSRHRMRGHARTFMTHLSHDSTCKSAPRSDLKRARTYRPRLNEVESISAT